MPDEDLVQANSQLQSLLDDVNSFIYDRSMPTVSAGEYVSSTADGGEAIQAAIDALPARGGRVHVPVMGPDDGITMYEGTVQDGVWHVNSTIDTGSKNAVWIDGAGPGWITVESGATLVAGSGVGSMVRLNNGFLDGIRNLNISGNENAANGVELGDGTDNDFKVQNCIIHSVNNAGILVNCDDNVWIDRCWIEDNEDGDGIQFQTFNRWAWLTNILFNTNEQDIFVNDTGKGLWVHNCRSYNAQGNANATIEFGADFDRISIKDVMLDDTGFAAIQVQSDATLTTMTVSGLKVYGGVNTEHVIRNQNQITDASLSDIYYENIGSAPFQGIVDDVASTTRLTFNGLGYNGANDPASAGDWNGNGEEGIRVLWDNGGTPTLAEYVNGTWYSRAL